MSHHKAAIIVRIETPRPPNFVRVEGSDATVPVGSLTDDELEALAAEMRRALFANARRQRRGRKDATR